MKKLLRTRPIWVLVLLPILAALLLTLGYSAIAKSRRADVPQTNTTASASSMLQPIDLAAPYDDDEDPAFIQKRREYLTRFYGTGPGQVSSTDFAASLSAARAVPPSPDDVAQAWTFPVPPPLVFGQLTSGARIDVIAVHPGDADTVYVGSEGGLAKSTDGGEHWTYLSNNLLSQSISAIAIDPNAPNIVYVGTGTVLGYGVGIYRSADSGATWSLISGPVVSSPFSGKAVVKLVVDPNTAGSTTTTTVYASVIHRDNNINYHSFWRSTDSGSNWTSFRSAAGAGGEPFYFNDIALNPDDPSEVYITAPDGVFTRDAWGQGSSWTQIHAQLPVPSAPSCLAFAPYGRVPGATLYLAYLDGNDTKIDKSSSGSYSTWTNIGSTPGNLFLFGVDPVHPNRIFVGGWGDLRYSMDGGATWLNPAQWTVHVDMHTIAFCPSDDQRHYLGNDGGIYRADYKGKDPDPIEWEDMNQNLAGALTQGVSISRDDRIFIGTQDNANLISRPVYQPWAWVTAWDPILGLLLGGDGTVPFIEFEANVEKMFAVTYVSSANYLITPNNGYPCRLINNVPVSVTPPDGIGEHSQIYPAMSVKFHPDTQGYADRVIMGFQNVWRSNNSGNNWTRIGGIPCLNPPSETCGIDPGSGSTPVAGRVTAVYQSPSNANTIYAITRYGTKVLKTSNANEGPDADWVDITRNVDGAYAIAVHPNDPLTVYLAGGVHVYKSADGGNTDWQIDDPGANFIYLDVKFHPANPDKIYVASHRGVYFRSSSGAWSSLNTGLPAGMAIANLSFNEYSHQLAASAYGRGVYVLDLDRVPPTATINFPTNGAHVRGTITVLGTALDNHRVADFQFKLDGVNLGGGGGDVPDVQAPNVSVSWNTASSTNGSHVLTLLVHDSYGTPTTSAAVTVTVDNLAPTVSITEPENGKEVSGKVTVSADAADNIGVAGVQFYLNGDSFGDELTSAPFSVDWDTSKLRNDEYTLVAVARDAAGNTTTSSTVTVTVSN
jgi:photosystem II stability/assembly factor-like uncharacterized protein